MQADSLGQGVELMLAGMGVVFIFLTVLVVATTLMSRIVIRYQPAGSAEDNDEEIAAISAAIARHRGKRHD